MTKFSEYATMQYVQKYQAELTQAARDGSQLAINTIHIYQGYKKAPTEALLDALRESLSKYIKSTIKH